MRSDYPWIQRRRAERIALLGLRCVLTVVLVAMGCVPWLAPGMVEQLDRAGIGPDFARFLGSAHLAGGIILLVPHLAESAAFILGLSVVGGTLLSPELGERLSPGGLAFAACLALALLLLGAALRLRHRDDAAAWHEMLARYAGRDDWRRFRSA